MRKLFSAMFLLFSVISFSQEIKVVSVEKPNVNYSGLFVIDNSLLWICGDKGTIGMSYNGGKNFKWVSPKDYQHRDFKDIYAWDHKNVIAIASGTPAIIIKSKDGGITWKEVFVDETPGVQFHSMDFYEYNNNKGIVIGNPVGNAYPYILNTENKGETWEKITSPDKLAPFKSGEKFVSNGSGNIKLLDDKFGYIYPSAGNQSNVFMLNENMHVHALEKSASATSGANAVDYSFNEFYGIVVGGDYTNPDHKENTIFVFEYDGKSKPKFAQASNSPSGYKTDVVIMRNAQSIVCGPSGVDFSNDKGKTWKPISYESFNTCHRAKNGNKVFLAGANGKIGIFNE